MNNFRNFLRTLAALLALPLSAFAHPGAAHQHSSAEVLIVGGVVLLAGVIGVLGRRVSKPEAASKDDATQRGQ